MITNELTYEAWMQAVDAEVEAIAGISVHDLADFRSRDWYENGVSPEEAAADVLAENGWDGIS